MLHVHFKTNFGCGSFFLYPDRPTAEKIPCEKSAIQGINQLLP